MLSRRSCLLSVPAVLAWSTAEAVRGGGPVRAAVGAEAAPDPVGVTPSREPADPVAAAVAAESLLSFSADVYTALATTSPGSGPTTNLVFSPYSVMTALAMTRAGAAGTTAQEMDRVLHTPQTGPDLLHAGLDALDQTIAAGSRRPGPDGADPQVVMAGANSLWGQQGLTWEPEFLSTLARYYDAGMNTVDYAGAPQEARARINGWVSERTRERIPELLSPDVLTPATRLTLVNALYLRAAWAWPFDAQATRPETFTRSDGSVVQVPLMTTLPRAVGYLAGDGWQAVDLPYAGSELAMAVVVPTGPDPRGLESLLDGRWLTALLTGFVSEPVVVRMPRWTFRLNTPLQDLLAGLGMPTAFGDQADFSAMTRDARLFISAVVHEAFVAVDEQGTEAAAATAVVMTESAAVVAPPGQRTVTADRPFLFVIHDTRTGAPLFLGRVGDPTP
jgi:serpin B